jgi:serine/threonine protein kinase/tetratricopeptide (TPR) repeat protein
MKSLLQQIGDYQILEKLGRGGMSDVYLAFDASNQRRVALKLVERGPGEDAREIVAAERLGAELQAHLSAIEPRVPKIHKFGDLEDYFFIDMEFVEGKDLSEIIRAGTLAPNIAAHVARELCSILSHAHSITLHADGREFRAIVHGDIKPRNIRIEAQGQVRVLDFGIAKGLSLTRKLTANLFGSVAYSSPERLESGRIDEMSDLWAVGVVLYEMVEGKLPFEAASTERLESIIRARTAPGPLEKDWPPELQSILHKSLARLPGRRYQSAEEFAADLSAFLVGEPTRAGEESEETRRTEFGAEDDQETRRTIPPSTSLRQDERAPDQPGRERSGTDAGRRKGRVRRFLIWAGIGSAVLLAALGIWQGRVYQAALQVRPDFVSAQMDPDAAWSEYQELRSRSLWGIAVFPLRGPLKKILRENSLKVMDDYRNSDQPKTRLGDWVRCKRYLTHAVEVDPADARSEAMLAYADGQILRINNKGLSAISAFQRSIQYDPGWSDPYLGMARTYIYNLKDMERGTQALQRAKDLGHQFGKRELAMMADAYNYIGMQAWDGAKRLRGSDQEKEILRKSKESLRQAIETYSQIAPWGESTKQIRLVQGVLDSVEDRLKELNPPNPLFPWNWFKKQLG